MSVRDYTAVECGVASRPLRGEVESGDLYAVIARPTGALIAVVDGLGHGYDAAVAARTAIVTLTAQAHQPVAVLVKSCHQALIKTRGVAMCIASLEWRAETMTWASVGNVAAVLLRSDRAGRLEREHIFMRNGVVGHRLPPLRVMTLGIKVGDLLILATDGLRDGFHSNVNINERPQDSADRILAEYGKATDDALVLVARWNGPPTAREREGTAPTKRADSEAK
jgi:negative regulator of sigma-B (phosphoserine phosphatase)